MVIQVSNTHTHCASTTCISQVIRIDYMLYPLIHILNILCNNKKTYLIGIACGYTSPLQGIGRYAKTIHQQGCSNVACRDDKQFGPALDAARHADATILVIGLDQSIEAETVDRTSLLLPGHQQDLVSKVAAASKGPTILVLMSGGPVDITFAKNDPKVAGILWAGYPGQAGGAAIADILFGTASPGLS